MLKAVVAGLTQHEHYLNAVLVDDSGQQAIPISLEWHNWWPMLDCLDDWRFFLPSTFELMFNLVQAAGGELVNVCLADINGDLTNAVVRLNGQGTSHEIAARPNDAITLAAVARLPILVSEAVMRHEGVWLPDSIRAQWKPGGRLPDPALKWISQTAMEQHTFRLDQVTDGLYISGVRRRPSLQRLQEENITHILRLYHMPVPWPDSFTVLDNTVDDGAFMPLDILQRGVQFIQQQRDAGHNVLVLCWEGVSRSSTFVLAYLVQELGYDLRDAWSLLYERHPKAWPAHQMWASLIAHYHLPYTMADVRSWLRENSRTNVQTTV